MNLSEMIEDDYTAHMIATGNLVKKRNEEARIAHLASSWTSQGYSARTFVQTCKCCSGEQSHVVGVFHDETNGLGEKRSTRLSDKGQVPTISRIFRETVSIPYCESCLTTLFYKED